MELPIKIVSTDFDGTVHTELEDPPVPAALQDRIAGLQAQGVKWVINTGRDLPALLSGLNAARLSVRPDYLVVVEREVHVRQGDGFDSRLPWNERCRRDQADLFARLEPGLAAVVAWIEDRFSATIYADAFSPFCLIASSNADADAILDHVARAFRHLPELAIVRNDIYARFSHSAYNKGTAMGEVARLAGCGRDSVFAAGDHYNDLPMLLQEHARYLVAPANAIPEVKAQVEREGGLVSQLPWGHGVAAGLDFFLNAESSRAPRLRRLDESATEPRSRKVSVALAPSTFQS